MASKPLVSVLVPSRGERFLNNTIDDLLEHATGDIEVIAVLDGYWPEPVIGDPRVRYLHRGYPRGMRAAINSAVALSRGEYLLKTDAHCSFGEGWDEILAADCDDDWVVVPRRDRLDAENWCLQETGKTPIDYMYLSYPDDPGDFGGPGLNGKVWEERNADPALREVLVDDLMSAQGSCWFMPRRYFDHLELMDEKNYGSFWSEFQEVGIAAWLCGGRVVVNKKTRYLHLHKGRTYGRGYALSKQTLNQGSAYARRWMHNATKMGPRQTRPFSWLIEHFWPVPTWPETWRDELWPEGEPWPLR